MPATLRFEGDDKDLTLDELTEFVESARKAGVPGENPVRAEVSRSGKIKQIEVVLGEDDSR